MATNVLEFHGMFFLKKFKSEELQFEGIYMSTLFDNCYLIVRRRI
jgi:hypothetical protein